MEKEKKEEELDEFMNSNRAGRRNALTADTKEGDEENKELAEKMQELNIGIVQTQKTPFIASFFLFMI